MHLLVEMHQVPENQNPPSSRREFVVESSVSEVRGFRTSSGDRSRHRSFSWPGCRIWARAQVAPDAHRQCSARGVAESSWKTHCRREEVDNFSESELTEQPLSCRHWKIFPSADGQSLSHASIAW
jgi:hypothetical protein